MQWVVHGSQGLERDRGTCSRAARSFPQIVLKNSEILVNRSSVLWASEVSWPWAINRSRSRTLTVNDPAPLDNMSNCGLDIVCIGLVDLDMLMSEG